MEEKVLDILERICEDDVVREDLDMDLFEEDLLDSLGFAELLVDIEEEFGIIIPPSEVERSDMNTANKIIAAIRIRS
ncbi:D-alanine--poly(phosphoribitol) ligase subunit DltC [Faecalicatena sp. AGMB00832]|uniref:D-alanyl carrier protein n=1 Tax=Faecalicatena faecalis TaxID=2726362 RepID=A0ABS6D1B8_9FIRM|nr:MULTISPECIES: D-alanine--poly(phosphoribitol) ligase subunit DltC [Faecalicatena]MBU3875281.1 D-alanine--poly(phosphoribitol) ligase subunit DltC [Faecalicatena faecalis]MCI6467917.1 D-alanine--poly(phosphoribitol) ligase subunit DltC [Faecalicatena sp.]MDY5619441.1 D-alanine--poly(phosphoribitol) ligase subunit DltC [Lachnospiraceae bacterium]